MDSLTRFRIYSEKKVILISKEIMDGLCNDCEETQEALDLAKKYFHTENICMSGMEGKIFVFVQQGKMIGGYDMSSKTFFTLKNSSEKGKDDITT